MNRTVRNHLFLCLIFFTSLFLESINWQSFLGQLGPSFLLLTFIYWNIAVPNKIGLSYAILFGLLLDLLNGNILGVNPLIFVLVSYLSQRFFYQFRVLRLFQQSIGIFLMSVLVNILLGMITLNTSDIFLGINSHILSLLLNCFINALLWAPFFYVSRFYRRRFILT